MVGLLLIGAAAWAVIPELASADDHATHARLDDAVLLQVGDLRTAVADWQVYFEPLVVQAGHVDTTSLTEGAVLAQELLEQSSSTSDGLASVGLTDRADELVTATEAFEDALAALTTVATEDVGALTVVLLAAERDGYTKLWDLTAATAAQLQEMRDVELDQARSHFDAARSRMLAVLALAAIAISASAVVFGSRARRQALVEVEAKRRHGFETTLQDGLDMAATEAATYGIVRRALHDAVTALQVELLIADSTRGHFRQTFHTGAGQAEERSGCDVVSPEDCPAAVHGRTIVFPTSSALDACPHLQDRPSGPCSAVCIPVSISGRAIGVLHATGVDHIPPNATDVACLETTTRRAGDRVSLLRAFERSETQAHTDPLTGLLNRRSLEDRVRDLDRDGTSYAVAYGDLDHFKMLNDDHGHDVGDQALRLFSRVLRDSIRPNDIAARYGGEEFVVVLPDSGTDAATTVLDRVRENLALASTTGRVPAFTVSFGLASSTDADTFDRVVIEADRALLAAKAAGRDRVVVADHRATAPRPPSAG